MKPVDPEHVARIAELARMAINADDIAPMGEDLSTILEFGEQLQSLTTDNVAPTSQVTGLVDVLREDKVVHDPSVQSLLLAQAPEIHEGYIKVKRVIR